MKLPTNIAIFNSILLLFFFFSKISIAQTYCPPNIDFEQNNFNHWFGNVGAVSQISNTNDTLIYPATPTGINAQQHIIRSAGFDFYGGFPVVNPYTTNGYSLQLGDNKGLAGSVCAQIKYYVHIPQGLNKYSLEYFYAAVLQNGGHQPGFQPDFRMTIFDSSSNNSVLQCSSFILKPLSLPGSGSSIDPSVHCQPWTASTINLDGLAGHTIVIQFDASDCAFGGHWGYAYIDFSTACALPVLTNGTCLGITTATVQADTGFSAYQWYDSSLTTLLGNNQTLILNPAPSSATKLYCVLTPLNHWGCYDTVPFYLPTSKQSTANFGFVKRTCAGSTIQFYDSSLSNSQNGFVNKWNWSFGDAYANANNPNTDSTKNPQHRFDSIGNYTVCLISNPNLNCLADTICKTIVINHYSPPLPLISSKDSLCGNSDFTTIDLNGVYSPTCNYYWLLDANTYLLNGNLNSGSPIKVSFFTQGNHTIHLQQIPQTNDTKCIATGSVNIFVKEISPLVTIQGVDSICPNSSALLTTLPATIYNYCGAVTASAITSNSTTPFIIGVNNAVNNNYATPFVGTESKCQMIYLASELHAMGFQKGIISEIGWNVLTKNSSSSGCANYPEFTIKMACVNYNSFNNISSINFGFDLTTPLTTVYSTNNYNTTLGLNSFVLQQPYSWDGVSNLLIQTCYIARPTSCMSSGDLVSSTSIGTIANSINVAPQNLKLFIEAESFSGLPACDANYPYIINYYYQGISVNNFYQSRPDLYFKAFSKVMPASSILNWTSNPAGINAAGDSLLISPNTTTTYTLTANNNGCITTDSQVVKIVNQFMKYLAYTTCIAHPYFFHGQWLNQTGIYFDTIHSSISCDTVLKLNLTVINTPFHNYLYQTICTGDSFNFFGKYLTQAGTYYDTIPTYLGCDSIINLNLQVGYFPHYSYLYETICKGTNYNFMGRIIDSTGTYYDTLPSSNPFCDSIIELNLLIQDYPNYKGINQTFCFGNSYNLHGKIISQPGIYYDTIIHAVSCDTIVVLSLNYTFNNVEYLNKTICHGSNYFFNGNYLTQSGTYYDTIIVLMPTVIQ